MMAAIMAVPARLHMQSVPWKWFLSKLNNPITFRNAIGLSNWLKTHFQAEMHVISTVLRSAGLAVQFQRDHFDLFDWIWAITLRSLWNCVVVQLTQNSFPSRNACNNGCYNACTEPPHRCNRCCGNDFWVSWTTRWHSGMQSGCQTYSKLISRRKCM